MQIKPIPSTATQLGPLYGAGSDGNVYRIIDRYGRIIINPKPLAPQPNAHARALVLNIDGKKVGRKIALLVAEAWIGPLPEGHCVRHKNGDRMDDRPSNLYYAENDRRSKLTPEQAREIYLSNESCTLLADRYDVSNDTVLQIRNGQIWNDATGAIRCPARWEQSRDRRKRRLERVRDELRG